MRRHFLLGTLLPLMLLAHIQASAQIKGGSSSGGASGVKSGSSSSGYSSGVKSDDYEPPPKPERERESRHEKEQESSYSGSSSYSTSDYSSSTSSSSSSSSPDYSSPSPNYSTVSSASASSSYTSPSSSAAPSGASHSSASGYAPSYSTTPPSTSSTAASSGTRSTLTYPAKAPSWSTGSYAEGGPREITGATPVGISPVVGAPQIDYGTLESAVAELALESADTTLDLPTLEDLFDRAETLQATLNNHRKRGREWKQMTFVLNEVHLNLNVRISECRTGYSLRHRLRHKALLVAMIMPMLPEDQRAAQLHVDSVLSMPQGGQFYYEAMQKFNPDEAAMLLDLVAADEPQLMEGADYWVIAECLAHFPETRWDAEVRHSLSRQMEGLEMLVARRSVLAEPTARHCNLVAHAMLLMEPDDPFFIESANYTYGVLMRLNPLGR